MAKFQVPDGWTVQAYRFALDLTLAQERAFRSHAGGARVAYNVMLARVKANIDQRKAERSYGIDEEDLTPPLDWSFRGLRDEWNGRKNKVAPWWAENSKEAVRHEVAHIKQARRSEGWSLMVSGAASG